MNFPGTGNEDFRAGFVAVVGRPNVGKSTLINHFVGSKVSIVSPRPQTTRHRILGVVNRPEAQVVFIDTPGMHVGQKKAINRVMNRTAVSALAEAEVIVWIIEAGQWTTLDQNVLQRLESVGQPVILVVNKTDLVADKAALLPFLNDVSARRKLHAVVPISALRGDQTEALMTEIEPLLPKSPAMFPANMRTDRGEAFLVAEIVREKLTLRLRQELPYGLTVQVEQIKRDGERLDIHAIIFVERSSQKGIVVGKGGSVLKAVGTSARREIMRLLDTSVHLELWVKVKENWADSEQDLRRLGFDMDAG
ncbi:MAG: GTPase Era [Pseudomonadota bacterium]